MKFSPAIVLLSAALASNTATASNIRKRNLQGWFGGDDSPFNNGDQQQADPFADILDALQNGLSNSMIDMSAIQAMDPMVLGDGQEQFFSMEDVFGLTTCTGPINVTLTPATVTGLSTLTMDRFELIPNTQQVEETGNWWTGMLMSWSGTFDMLMTADNLVLEMGITIATDDMSCLGEVGAPADNSPFSTGIKMSMAAPVLDVKLEIGGVTPESFFGGLFGEEESVAETMSTDEVSFTYDSWTIQFDNPMVFQNQTINVTEVLMEVDTFLQAAMNSTELSGLDGQLQELFDLEGLDLSSFNMEGINEFIQEQANVAISRQGGFSF